MTASGRIPVGKNIIAVASGKGGVGKTWFSITLAEILAEQGRKVLLFDGDLGLANVDVQLGLTPDRDIGTVTGQDLPLAAAITRYNDGGFDIMAGQSGSTSLASLSPAKLADMCTELVEVAGTYDHVILDLGAGVDRTVRMLSMTAAQTFVVVNDEPTSLTDGYAFIKLNHNVNHSAGIQIVVNMAANILDGQKTYKTLLKACKNFLQLEPPMAGLIRRDARVKDAIRHQIGIVRRHPGCDAVEDVTAIAAKVQERVSA